MTACAAEWQPSVRVLQLVSQVCKRLSSTDLQLHCMWEDGFRGSCMGHVHLWDRFTSMPEVHALLAALPGDNLGCVTGAAQRQEHVKEAMLWSWKGYK